MGLNRRLSDIEEIRYKFDNNLILLYGNRIIIRIFIIIKLSILII